jgi:hypothetical protein
MSWALVTGVAGQVLSTSSMSLVVVVVVLTTTAIPGVGDSIEPPIVIPM